jgi:small nuclear ribonucleoprotein (snRNP)-like protein
MDSQSFVDALEGREVVIDLASQYVILGTLRGRDTHHYIVDNADVHDLRDTTTSRELYVLDAKRHGINATRKRVFVRMDGVVSLSNLADVIE